MHWTVLLLIPLGATLAAEPKGPCAAPTNPVIRGVEDPRVEWRTQRLIDAHPSALSTRNGSSGTNFSELLELDGIQLRRVERTWLNYYRRVSGDQFKVRYLAIQMIGKIYGLNSFEKELAEESEGRSDKPSEEDLSLINQTITDNKVSLEETASGLYLNCSTWLEMLDDDWRRYLGDKNNSAIAETLTENIKTLAGNSIRILFNASSLIDMELPLEIKARVLSNHQKYSWIKFHFQQHLQWIRKGKLTLPYNDDKCATGRLVPTALDVSQLVIDAKRDFQSRHNSLISKENFSKTEMWEKESNILQSLIEAREKFSNTLKGINQDELHERIMIGHEIDRLDALIELERRVLSRIEFYSNQPKEYFETPVSVLPIEKALEEAEKSLERAIRKHTYKCVLWSEMLDADWKSYRANTTTNATKESDIREIYQALQQKARDMKNLVVKLWEDVPSEFSRYLPAETEFEMIAAEKFYERLAVLFGENLQKTQSTTNKDIET